MTPMNNGSAPSSRAPVLHVLLVGPCGAASEALEAWLAENSRVWIEGSFASTAEALALAFNAHPDVVLLDFHGLPVSVAYTVTLFKQLLPAPAIFVLTHDASPSMRRRCASAGVDRVFDKTTELDALGAALRQMPSSTAGRGPPPQPCMS